MKDSSFPSLGISFYKIIFINDWLFYSEEFKIEHNSIVVLIK